MKPKTQRTIFIIIGLALIAASVTLILNNFKDNLVFFYSPSELKDKVIKKGEIIRVGGLIMQGSIRKTDINSIEFTVTDFDNSIKISYTGMLPVLFREGQGIIAKGKYTDKDLFIADELLAKHDEKYMPPEITESLKKKSFK